MLTGANQTWAYLEQYYPELYALGQKRLEEAKRNGTLNCNSAIGVNQFDWSKTIEGASFWFDLYYYGTYETIYNPSNFFTQLNLISNG